MYDEKHGDDELVRLHLDCCCCCCCWSLGEETHGGEFDGLS